MGEKTQIPLLSQCYLCSEWFIEEVLETIGVPDQTGHVMKKCCRVCLDKVEARSLRPIPIHSIDK